MYPNRKSPRRISSRKFPERATQPTQTTSAYKARTDTEPTLPTGCTLLINVLNITNSTLECWLGFSSFTNGQTPPAVSSVSRRLRHFRNLPVITPRYTTTSIMKDIFKTDRLKSKNAQLLSLSGSISVPHDDWLEVPFMGVQVCLTTPLGRQ